MVGIVHIFAHLGCFVPAEYASLRLCDQILTRMTASDEAGSLDDMSTYQAECKELAYILNHVVSNRALVLVGRHTAQPHTEENK